MAEDLIEKGFTLFRLLESDIAVPDYQRDYAQGRMGDAKIKDTREKFVDDIITAAEAKKEDIVHMGLVYGSHNRGLDGFVAVDGQQRLTTAFLFHLYLTKRISTSEKEELSERLLKFGWHGRPYASEFLEFLFDIDNWNDIELSLSGHIKGSAQYFDIWERDPTVDNMLNVLDVIHEKLRDASEDRLLGMVSNLMSVDCKLQFDCMRLRPDTDEFQYQKMNSRGRDLTTYELFKQKFQDKADLTDRFKESMDNKWLKFFDDFASDQGGEYEADIYYQNYINEVSLLFGIHFNGDKFEYIDSITGSKVKSGSTQTDVRFVPFEAYAYIRNHPEKFELVTDWLIENYEFVQRVVSEFKFNGKNADVTSLFCNNIEWLSRAIFCAVLTYGWKTSRLLRQLSEDEASFRLWWRPVYNLLAGTDINKDNFARIKSSIDQLPVEDMYGFLCETVDPMSFNKEQWNEEKRKAVWCMANPDLIDLFAAQERRRRFQGRISLLLPPNDDLLTSERWIEIVNRFDELNIGRYDKEGTDFAYVSTMFSFVVNGEVCRDSWKYEVGDLRGDETPAVLTHKMLFDYIEKRTAGKVTDASHYFQARREEWLMKYKMLPYPERESLFWLKHIYADYDRFEKAFVESKYWKIRTADDNHWLYYRINRCNQDIILTNWRDEIVELFAEKSDGSIYKKHDKIARHPHYSFLQIVFEPSNIWIGIDGDASEDVPEQLPDGFAKDANYKARLWLDSEKCHNYYEQEGESREEYINRLFQAINDLCRDFLSRLGLLSGDYSPIVIGS